MLHNLWYHRFVLGAVPRTGMCDMYSFIVAGKWMHIWNLTLLSMNLLFSAEGRKPDNQLGKLNSQCYGNRRLKLEQFPKLGCVACMHIYI